MAIDEICFGSGRGVVALVCVCVPLNRSAIRCLPCSSVCHIGSALHCLCRCLCKAFLLCAKQQLDVDPSSDGRVTISQKAAAWHWLHEGSGLSLGGGPVDLSAGWCGKLVAVGLVMKSVVSPNFYASLGNGVWAALGWPLRVRSCDEDGNHLWDFDVTSTAEPAWMSITSATSWNVYPYKALRTTSGVCIKQVGPPETLLKAALRHPYKLGFSDLVSLVRRHDLPGTENSTRQELLSSLANFAGHGDEAFVATVIASTAPMTSTSLLVEDPLFDATYEGLDDDDKREFPEVKEAKQKGQKRKLQEVGRLRRAVVTAKVKAKSRAKARAQAKRGPIVEPPALADAMLPADASGGDVLPPGAPPVLEADAAARSSGQHVDNPPVPDIPRRIRVPASALRGSRAEPFGTSFVLAGVYPSSLAGQCGAWSARCFLHTDGPSVCNKSFNLGTDYSEEEARHRIMQWCVAGGDILDEPGGRARHMAVNPRLFAPHDLLPVATLLERAGAM